MKKETWLILANSSLARVYKIENGHSLKEVTILEHPESRLHNLDLVSDRPGRGFESAGVGRHALEPKTLPKKQEFESFAKSIAAFVENAQQKNTLEGIYLAASPALLGLLRESFHPNSLKLVKEEIDKDLTQLPLQEIPEHLPFLMYGR